MSGTDEAMAEITMYTTGWCGYCVRAKALLDDKGLRYEEINLDGDPHFRQRNKRAPDRRVRRALAARVRGKAS